MKVYAVVEADNNEPKHVQVLMLCKNKKVASDSLVEHIRCNYDEPETDKEHIKAKLAFMYGRMNKTTLWKILFERYDRRIISEEVLKGWVDKDIEQFEKDPINNLIENYCESGEKYINIIELEINDADINKLQYLIIKSNVEFKKPVTVTLLHGFETKGDMFEFAIKDITTYYNKYKNTSFYSAESDESDKVWKELTEQQLNDCGNDFEKIYNLFLHSNSGLYNFHEMKIV